MAPPIRLRSANVRRGTAAGMGIDVEISPSPIILIAELEGIAKEMTDFKKPLKNAIKNVMIPSIRKNFDAEGRPEHWAPLSQATLNRRRFDGSGVTNKILSRTGKLQTCRI